MADTFGISQVGLIVLGTLPVLVLGLAAWMESVLHRCWGTHRPVILGLVAVSAGLLVRPMGAAYLFLGTLVAATGIAVLGVLLPSGRPAAP